MAVTPSVTRCKQSIYDSSYSVHKLILQRHYVLEPALREAELKNGYLVFGWWLIRLKWTGYDWFISDAKGRNKRAVVSNLPYPFNLVSFQIYVIPLISFSIILLIVRLNLF